MNTHDIDIELPHVAFCRVSDVDPHESHHRQPGVSADTRLYTEDQVRAAIEADRKRQIDATKVVAELVAIIPLSDTMKASASCQDLIDYFKGVIADHQRRGEPVAMIRHFHYQGIARSGLAQEAVMLDGAPTLPDGAMLYAAPQPVEPDVLPGEAIFGFAAWLTSLKTPVTFSECHGAAVGADLAAAYNTSQGFDRVREDYHKRLKHYPKDEPPQPAEPVNVDPPGPNNAGMGDWGKPAEPVKVSSDDALDDALSNLEHDNYEQSYSGYKNRQADIALIRALLARHGGGHTNINKDDV